MKRLVPLITLAALAGCGGGGGNSSSSIAPVAPTMAPTTAPVTPASGVRSTFSFFVPSRTAASSKRRPAYVSAGSTQAVFTLSAFNGGTSFPAGTQATQTFALTTTGTTPACTAVSGGENCNLAVLLPPGSDTLTIQVEDAAGAVLSAVAGQTYTIAAAATTTESVALQPVYASVTLSVPAMTAGTAVSSGSLPFAAADAAGGAIPSDTTPFLESFTLRSSDPTNVSLALNGGPYGAQVTVTKPNDVVTFNYSGLALGPNAVTITTGETAAPGNPVLTNATTAFAPQLNPIVLAGSRVMTDTSTGNPWSGDQEVILDVGGASANFTASETGWSNAPYARTFTPSIAPSGYLGTTLSPISCSGVVMISTSDGLNFTAVPGSQAGACAVTIADGVGQTATLWVLVNSTAIGVN
jgi:hypothetical protein